MEEGDEKDDPKPTAPETTTMMEILNDPLTTIDSIDSNIVVVATKTLTLTDEEHGIKLDGMMTLQQQQQQQQQTIVDMEDVWATSEGYTPLQDFNTGSNTNTNDNNDTFVSTGAFFSDGTTGGTIYTSFPGAFYANIAQQQQNSSSNNNNNDDDDDNDDNDWVNDDAVETRAYQDYNYLHNEDDDDGDDDDDGEMTTTVTTTTTTTNTSLYDSIPDYRSVAENALSMLDREYNNIISLEQQQQQQQRHGNTNEEVPSEPDSDHEEDEDDDDDNNYDVNLSIDGHTVEANQDLIDELNTSYVSPKEAKVVKHIDTEAVRRAVQTIQLKNPKLEQNLRLWEQKQQLQRFGYAQRQQPHPSLPYTYPNNCMAPRIHPIIPELPLTAFRKYTSIKAIQATANLTRSVCIAEALHRYNILQYHAHQEQTIRIHVLGCDHVEIGYYNTNSTTTPTNNEPRIGYDLSRIRTLFGPIVRWVGAYAEAPSHIRIELIGPNIPIQVATTTHTSPIDLLPTNTPANDNTRKVKECLQSATLRCHSGTYEDILQNDTETNDIGVPDLAIAFNAGIWGYNEWVSTIRYMIQHPSTSTIPFVVTAYTFEEAEDDYDTIAEIVKEQCPTIDPNNNNKQVQCVWDVEYNPFASNQEYQPHSSTTTTTTNSTSSSRRRENAAWQSWRL